MGLISHIEIRSIEQCTADPMKVKITAQADHAIGEFLPYLLALDPRADYSERGGFVTFKVGQSNVTVFATGKVTATKLEDEANARSLLDGLTRRINELNARRDRLDLRSLRERRALSILEVLRQLPRTNCGACGHPTCMAFAASIVRAEVTTSQCVPLYEGSTYSEQRCGLEGLLTAAGYGHLAEGGG
jgi:ArsR family metal-binding transcriptional regulator